MFDQQTFEDATNWIKSVSSQTQFGYFAVAIVIQQNIEPILREKETKIQSQGENLSAEIIQSKGFKIQLETLSALEGFDTTVLPFLDGSKGTVKESILISKARESVSKVSDVLVMIFPNCEEQSLFKKGFDAMINQISELIKGPFIGSAQVLLNNNNASFPPFAHRQNEQNKTLLATQDFFKTREQLQDGLSPQQFLFLSKKYEHGNSETTDFHFSFTIENDEIKGTRETAKNSIIFTDLRNEKESVCHYQEINEIVEEKQNEKAK